MDLSLLSKSYDLRGIAGSELTETDYRNLGKAFARIVEGETFALGRDARVSSPAFSRAFAEGVSSQGKNVADVGVCSTDMLQFSTVRYPEIDAGFMITASHNPKEYNGLKSCLKDAVPVNLKEWAPRVMEAIGKPLPDAPVPGSIFDFDIVADWAEHVASFAGGADFSGLKVVADAGNGTAGVFMQAVADRLGFELVPFFFEPDGTFPNHHPSPIESKNTVDLRARVCETGADIGVAFDGDADRAVMCDETGEIVSASAVMCAIIEGVLARKPGASVVYNTVSSEYVPEFTRSLGGNPIREKVGHVYIKELMARDPSIEFGGEHSSHYYFRANANADSGVIAFVHFLAIMAQKGKKASELRKEYRKYPEIEETNFRVSDVAETIERVRRAYPDVTPDFFDGITLKTADYRLNLRPSSNEPLVRLNLEAKDETVLKHEFEKITGILKKSS
jgi:phosphomannomutase